MDANRLGALVADSPPLALATALAALVAVAVIGWMVRRLARGHRPDEVLTPIAAAAATGVAMTGMWKFFGDVLDASGPLRIALFAFLELAMVTSAVRARRNIADTGAAGLDGAAVWAITGMSAVLAATDAGSVRAALLRLAAPILAAWLWHRGLAAERRHADAKGAGRRIHWRITPERILVRLGLAEAADRTASQVDAHRRLTRLARVANQVRRLEAAGAKPRRKRRALARLDRAMDAAVEHAGLATDPSARAALLDQLAALYHAAGLAEVAPPNPWTAPAAPAQPALPVPYAPPSRTGQTRTDDSRTAPRTGVVRTDRVDGAGEPRALRTGPARTGTGSRTRTPVDRDQVVADLAAEIHAAIYSGDRWTPDYLALQERTGYRRSWCEKVVRDARDAALRTHHADGHPAEGGTVVELARTSGQ
ncbi:hypothetical protein [Actinomadura welshii]|uniref:hypothetical protein n=1 Tax=Actinomadura welshii TaxID=3103817 RepID=UPI0003AD42A0|nr:hypothetical protein [Actinomadura madurae]